MHWSTPIAEKTYPFLSKLDKGRSFIPLLVAVRQKIQKNTARIPSDTTELIQLDGQGIPAADYTLIGNDGWGVLSYQCHRIRNERVSPHCGA